MKRSVVPAVVLIGLMLAGFATVRYLHEGAKQVSLDNAMAADWLVKRLALDQEQEKKVRALQAEYVSKLTASCAAHCKACCSLHDVVFAAAGTNDPAPALIAAMSKALADGELATIQHMRAIHASLRPEQQKEFEKIVNRCFEMSDSVRLCKPSGSGSCGMKGGADGCQNCSKK